MRFINSFFFVFRFVDFNVIARFQDRTDPSSHDFMIVHYQYFVA